MQTVFFALANTQPPDNDEPICDDNHVIANIGPSTVGPDTTRRGGLEIRRGQHHANVKVLKTKSIYCVDDAPSA